MNEWLANHLAVTLYEALRANDPQAHIGPIDQRTPVNGAFDLQAVALVLAAEVKTWTITDLVASAKAVAEAQFNGWQDEFREEPELLKDER